jgi:hypothetical protein
MLGGDQAAVIYGGAVISAAVASGYLRRPRRSKAATRVLSPPRPRRRRLARHPAMLTGAGGRRPGAWRVTQQRCSGTP